MTCLKKIMKKYLLFLKIRHLSIPFYFNVNNSLYLMVNGVPSHLENDGHRKNIAPMLYAILITQIYFWYHLIVCLNIDRCLNLS